MSPWGAEGLSPPCARPGLRRCRAAFYSRCEAVRVHRRPQLAVTREGPQSRTTALPTPGQRSDCGSLPSRGSRENNSGLVLRGAGGDGRGTRAIRAKHGIARCGRSRRASAATAMSCASPRPRGGRPTCLKNVVRAYGLRQQGPRPPRINMVRALTGPDFRHVPALAALARAIPPAARARARLRTRPALGEARRRQSSVAREGSVDD